MTISSSKKVLLWGPRGAGTHYNGPGSFAYRLYQEQPLSNNEVTLAHSNPDQSANTLPFKKVVEVSTKATSVGKLQDSGRWAASNASDYDIFHGLGGFHPTVYPAWQAERAGLPVVLFPMLSGVEFSHSKGLGGALRLPVQRRLMARRFSGFVAMSSSIEEELLTSGVDPSRVARIPMGIDCKRFSPSDMPRSVVRAALGLQDLPTVIFCGSATRRKQPHLLLEALLRVGKQIKVQVLFVGPMNEEDYALELKELSSQLPQNVACVFVGHTTGPERFMQASDVFCLPSRSEGQPASALEAMACGLAQVVTELPGLDSYIDEESGGFYAKPTASDIADRLLKAFETNSDQRHQARCLIEARCSLERVAAAHDQLFDLVLAGESPNKASLEN